MLKAEGAVHNVHISTFILVDHSCVNRKERTSKWQGNEWVAEDWEGEGAPPQAILVGASQRRCHQSWGMRAEWRENIPLRSDGGAHQPEWWQDGQANDSKLLATSRSRYQQTPAMWPVRLSGSLRHTSPCSFHSGRGEALISCSGPCHLAKERNDWFLPGWSPKKLLFSQSVFKNYDHDQDGYISQEEFEKIAASFPFSFCVMDKDRWGFVCRNNVVKALW